MVATRPTDLGKQLRKFLLLDPQIKSAVDGKRIHQNHVPQNRDKDYVWYGRMGSNDEDDQCLSGDDEDFRFNYQLEIVSLSGERTISLTERIRQYLRKVDNWNCFGVPIQAIFVDFQSDQFQFRNNFIDEGLHIGALTVEIVTCG